MKKKAFQASLHLININTNKCHKNVHFMSHLMLICIEIISTHDIECNRHEKLFVEIRKSSSSYVEKMLMCCNMLQMSG